MPSLTLITAPTEYPIAVSDLRDFPLRLNTVDDDPSILALIKAATIYGQKYTKRQFVTSTWEYRLDRFPCYEIELPTPPLSSVTFVKYYDTGGTLQTLSSTLYTVDTYKEPGVIYPGYSLTWPTTQDIENAVVVRFVAGYGAASAVPETIKTALKRYVKMQYDGQYCDEYMDAVNSLFAVENWGCYA